MLDAILLTAVVGIIVVWLSFSYKLASRMRNPEKKDPADYEWGSGKDLSSLLPDAKLRELEQWWQNNESKDAKIRELEETISRLKERNIVLERERRDPFQDYYYKQTMHKYGLLRPSESLILPYEEESWS